MTLTIEPGRASKHYWRDLWRYRELLLVLAWRDVAVRYKQTSIGVVWALLRPLLTMIILTVVFGRLAKLPSEGHAPYALMVLSGMLPWMFFSSALSDSANSIVTNSGLVSKIYFPRAIVPLASIAAGMVDFLIGLMFLFGIMVFYGILPTWRILFLPFFTGMATASVLGPGLLISALNVSYRDFRYILPFVVQFGLYVSPVGFSSSVVPERWRLLYALNPMVGVIDGFRWAILGGESRTSWITVGISVLVIAVLLLVGVHEFRRRERAFADLI
jgi:lipopolysaccharide transport system permease protein